MKRGLDLKNLPLSFWVSLGIILLVNGVLTYSMIAGQVFSDFPAHVDMLSFYLERGKFPFPPLYYLSFGVLGWMIPLENSFKLGLLILIITSWAWKYVLTYTYSKFDDQDLVSFTWLPLAFLFLFPISLPLSSEYGLLGKFSPNIWHNGTSIMVWPFCFLLFNATLQYLKGEPRFLKSLFIYSLLILLIKPSYLFGFLPGVFSLLMIRKVSKKTLKGLMGLAFFVLTALVLSKILIFDLNDTDSVFYNFNSKGGVILDVGGVWLSHSNNPVWDLLSSFLLPILICVFYWKALQSKLDFQLSGMVLLFSVLVFLLISESGPGYLDGNFYWQIPISLYLFLLVLVKRVIQHWRSQANHQRIDLVKFYTVMSLFFIQVFSGIGYLIRISYTGSFL